MSHTDAERIRDFRDSGNREALAELFTEHQGRVLNLAAAFLRDAHEAEDVAQEVFLRVQGSLGTLRDPVAFPAWIDRIAVGLSINRRRSRQVRLRREGAVVMSASSDAGSADVDLPVAELRGAMDTLSDEERDALILRYHHGKSFEEVGEALSCAASTAKYRVDQGIAQLRRKLAPSLGALAAIDVEAMLPKTGIAHPVSATLSEAIRRIAWEGTDASVSAPDALPSVSRLISLPIIVAVILGVVLVGTVVWQWKVGSSSLQESATLGGVPEKDGTAQSPVKDSVLHDADLASEIAPVPRIRVGVRGCVVDRKGRPIPGIGVGIIAKSGLPFAMEIIRKETPAKPKPVQQISVWGIQKNLREGLRKAVSDEQAMMVGLIDACLTNTAGNFSSAVAARLKSNEAVALIGSLAAPWVNIAVPFQWRSGETVDLGRIVLPCETVSVEGVVVDTNGQPVSEARVWVTTMPLGPGGETREEGYGNGIPDDGTDETGSYHATFFVAKGWSLMLGAEQSFIEVVKPGYVRQRVKPEMSHEGVFRFKAVLTGAGIVSGRVVDAAGRPVEGVEVAPFMKRSESEIEGWVTRARDRGRTEDQIAELLKLLAKEVSASESVYTGADGTFRFDRLESGREHRFVPRDRRSVAAVFVPDAQVIYPPASDLVFQVSGTDETLGELNLQIDYPGQVFEGEGRPGLGAWIRVYLYHSKLELSATCDGVLDERGSFKTKRLLPGTYTPYVSAWRRTSVGPPVTIRAGVMTDVRFTLEPGVLVTVDVIDEQGKAVDWVVVSRMIQYEGVWKEIGAVSGGWKEGALKSYYMQPGRYRIQSRTGLGFLNHTTFDVDIDSTPNPRHLRFRLMTDAAGTSTLELLPP